MSAKHGHVSTGAVGTSSRLANVWQFTKCDAGTIPHGGRALRARILTSTTIATGWNMNRSTFRFGMSANVWLMTE